jgi:putative transposase
MDGRGWAPTRLTAAQLEERRRAAVAMLRRGEPPSEVARRLGVSRVSVWRWWQAFRAEGRRGLRARPRPGRPARLAARQWGRLTGLLEQGADAAGVETERWTLTRIAAVVAREFGVRYHPRYLERPLKAHGFTVHRPAARARERDELVIARWPTREWVALKKRRGAPGARWSSWTRRGTASARGRARRGRAAA